MIETLPDTRPVIPEGDARVTDWPAILRPERLWDPLMLDVGALGDPYDPERYTLVDLYGEPDVRADIRALPFADGAVHAIWCSHVLEHLPMGDVAAALRELGRVLRPHGRAIVRVPNFDYVAKYWLTGPERTWAEQLIYGQQNHEGDFHRSAFTAGTIRADMEAAGFEVLRVEMRWTHSQETLQAVARKPA